MLIFVISDVASRVVTWQLGGGWDADQGSTSRLPYSVKYGHVLPRAVVTLRQSLLELTRAHLAQCDSGAVLLYLANSTAGWLEVAAGGGLLVPPPPLFCSPAPPTGRHSTIV